MEELAQLRKRLNEAEGIMLKTMDYITENLRELNAIEEAGQLTPELYNRKCALVEILENLMTWSEAKNYGYSWDVETEFPV